MEGTISTVSAWAPNFAPRNWAFCDGTLLQVSSFSALFSLLGTIYGGDGRSTFGLPDLQQRVAMGNHHGPGLSNRVLGQQLGSDSVLLTTAQIPSHTHAATVDLDAVSTPATTNVPGPTLHLAGADLAGNPVGGYGPGDGVTVLGGLSFTSSPPLQATGGGQAHENRMPFQVLSYIICLSGVFPSRN